MKTKDQIIIDQMKAEAAREFDLAKRLRGLDANDRRTEILREYGQDGGAPMKRFFSIEAADFDDENQAFSFVFSSEYPGERYFGIEILSHEPEAVLLDRMNEGGAFCVNHDTLEGHVGTHEWARLDGDARVCRGRARLSKNNERAVREYLDIKDGIRRHISTGYWIHDVKLVRTRDDGLDEWLVTKWEPLENSTVAVPFDPTVGVGRSLFTPEPTTEPQDAAAERTTEETEMSDTKTTDQAQAAPAAPAVDVGAERDKAQAAERTRAEKIIALGEKLKAPEGMAREFIASGKTPVEFTEAVLEKRGSQAPAEPPVVGLTDRETKRFSFIKLIRAASDPKNAQAQAEAAFEYEVTAASREVAERAGYAVKGAFSIPHDVMAEKRNYRGTGRRDISAGAGGTGQYLVDTDMMSMVELLDNAMMVQRLGAQVFSNLTGDVAFPKATGGATTYWVNEAGSVTGSTPTFGQVMMRPKTVGALTDLTRRIVLQSSVDIENWLRMRQAIDRALAIDLAAINGAGSAGEPLGLLNTTGIGSVPIATDGGAPTYLHMCALEREVSVDNALMGRVAFLTNPKVRYKLRSTPENATVPNSRWVYEGNGPDQGTILGYPAYITNQVPSTLVKGNSGAVCSPIILGNWSDLYLGYWGPVSINVDTATLSASGGIRVVTLQDVDVALPRPQSFAAVPDATTT